MASRLNELVTLIARTVGQVDAHLKHHGISSPSFEENVALEDDCLSPEVDKTRLAAIEATLELHDLLMGPTMLLRPIYNATSLQAIYRFDIAEKVHIESDISFVDLAKICNLKESDLRRIIRFAISYHRVFREPRKGYVAHSAASLSIKDRPGVKESIGVMFDEVWQSYARTVDALEQFPVSEPNLSGFALAHNTDLSYFEYLRAHPSKFKRFVAAMQAFGDGPDISTKFLVNEYPWQSLGHALVVDVGGSNGSVSKAIAEKHTDLSFVIQDLPHVIQSIEEVQKMKADLYLFRYIFHNWPDSYAIRILRQLIPVLRPGARILINDHLLPEPNTVSLTAEREARSMDMLMMTLCNARERDREDWVALFRAVSDHFRVTSAFTPEGSSLGIIEAVWNE